MKLKEFSLDIPGKGRAEVSFYLHFDTNTVTVGEIKIHTDFESTIPHRAWLKQYEGEWKLYDDHPSMINNEVVVGPEYLADDLSKAIAERIIAIRTQEQ
jgi:hypothetical protein